MRVTERLHFEVDGHGPTSTLVLVYTWEDEHLDRDADPIDWADHLGPSLDPSDARRPRVKRLDVLPHELRVWEMPAPVGSFGFRRRGGPIAATNSGFCGIDLDGGRFERRVDPEPHLPHNPLNDGKIDRRGRFWCSSMDTRVEAKTASIHRSDPDLGCRRVAEDLRFVVGNGIAFDPEDRRMYLGDTIGNTVYVFDFDVEEGSFRSHAFAPSH